MKLPSLDSIVLAPDDPTQQAAALETVARHATDRDDEARLAAMLGLVEPERPARPRKGGDPTKPRKRPVYGSQGCGTRAAYQRHKDRGQTPCKPCYEAHRAYMREYARARYDPAERRARYERDKANGHYDRTGTA